MRRSKWVFFIGTYLLCGLFETPFEQFTAGMLSEALDIEATGMSLTDVWVYMILVIMWAKVWKND